MQKEKYTIKPVPGSRSAKLLKEKKSNIGKQEKNRKRKKEYHKKQISLNNVLKNKRSL
jgi:hypothetical protein